MGIGCAATFKVLPQYIKHAVAGSSGLISGFGALGGVIWPILMGIIASISSYAEVFILFLILGLIGVFTSIAILVQMSKDAKSPNDLPGEFYFEYVRSWMSNCRPRLQWEKLPKKKKHFPASV